MPNINEQISNVTIEQQDTKQAVEPEVEREFETLLQKPVGLRSKASVFSDEKLFESAQRMAKLLSSADLVPEIYRGNIANSTIAIELAQRIGASPLAVMQNLYIVHGKPGWSAQFIIASLNTCGRYSPLRFAMSNDNNNTSCFAWAYDLSNDKERIDGPTVSMQMAMDEGWYQKKGSKWKTMPEVMLRYRAASFFGKLYAPEIMMGMQSSEELIDMGEPTKNSNSGQTGTPTKGLGGVKSKLKQHTKDNHIMDVSNNQQEIGQEVKKTVVIDNQNVDVSTGEIIDAEPAQANQADQADQSNQANQDNGNKMINVSETAKAVDNPNDRLKANLENRQNKQTQRKTETTTNTNNKNTHMDRF